MDFGKDFFFGLKLCRERRLGHSGDLNGIKMGLLKRDFVSWGYGEFRRRLVLGQGGQFLTFQNGAQKDKYRAAGHRPSGKRKDNQKKDAEMQET